MPILDKIASLLGGDFLKSASDIIDKFVTTPSEKAEAQKQLTQMIQNYQITIESMQDADRANARNREIEIAKTGKKDIMMLITGITGLIAFAVVIYCALFVTVKDKEIFYFIAGNVFGIATAIFMYYYGSSHGSQQTKETLDKVLQKKDK